MKGLKMYGMPSRKTMRKSAMAEDLERRLKWRLAKKFTDCFSRFTDQCMGRVTELGSSSPLLKHVMADAFRGVYPDLKISYRQVVFIPTRAKNWYPYLINYRASLSEDGMLHLRWKFRDLEPRHFSDDQLILYAYNEDTGEGMKMVLIVDYELDESEVQLWWYKPACKYHFWIFEYQNPEAYGRSFYLDVTYNHC